jgi:hypothetical protein
MAQCFDASENLYFEANGLSLLLPTPPFVVESFPNVSEKNRDRTLAMACHFHHQWCDQAQSVRKFDTFFHLYQ